MRPREIWDAIGISKLPQSAPQFICGPCFLAIIDDTGKNFSTDSPMVVCGVSEQDWPYKLAAPKDRIESSNSLTHHIIMKPHLVQAASAVVPSQQILVNMVSRRVRQLCLGHRPLVEFVPGLGHADVALSEIAAGKLVFESTFGQNGNFQNGATEVVAFPGVIVDKKATKKHAA